MSYGREKSETIDHVETMTYNKLMNSTAPQKRSVQKDRRHGD